MGQIENIIILCAIGMFATCLVACVLEAFIVYFTFRDRLNREENEDLKIRNESLYREKEMAILENEVLKREIRKLEALMHKRRFGKEEKKK